MFLQNLGDDVVRRVVFLFSFLLATLIAFLEVPLDELVHIVALFAFGS